MQPDVANEQTWPLAGMLLLFLLFGLVSALGNLFSQRFLLHSKGRLGEAAVNRRLRRGLDPRLYQLLPNVILPVPGGTTQIDHVLLSPFGIFVIETKTYAGWIYGRVRDANWTQVLYRHKQPFQNPLRQNYKHTQTLSQITGLPHEHFQSVIVFAGDAQLKTRMPPNVIQLRDLVRYIHSHQTPVMSPESVLDIVLTIDAARLRRHRLPAHAVRTQPPSTPRSQSHRRDQSNPHPIPRPANHTPPTPAAPDIFQPAIRLGTCTTCRSQASIQWGKYNYYWKCQACGQNMPIQITCPTCSRRMKIRKDKSLFFQRCDACRTESLYHDAAELVANSAAEPSR